MLLIKVLLLLQACAVMALERVPADIRRDGGVARMTDPKVSHFLKPTKWANGAEMAWCKRLCNVITSLLRHVPAGKLRTSNVPYVCRKYN